MKNPSKLFLSFLIVVFSSQAMSLETDNYLSWGLNLKDSGEEINLFVSEQIKAALDESAEKPNPQTCEEVTFAISKRFKTTPTTKSLETFVNETLDKENIFPKDPYYLEESILKNSSRFYLKYSGLSPNLQMNGIYFGADKLSHFASTGRRYLKHYLKKIKQGFSQEDATKSMIRFGLMNEKTVLGIWASGVFSYGDMEANYQGFLFYKKLCLDQENTYLSKDENGKWFLTKKPDMGIYVSPYWDETFNRSFFAWGTWKKTSKIIKKEYCPKMSHPDVINRMKFYQSFPHSSFSLDYISELQASDHKRSPSPDESQSMNELCQLSSLAASQP